MADVLNRLRAALADRYRIESELGSGGMATVYLAEDLKHRRQVAIKVMRPELAASLGAERFLREIQISAQLNHPNILTLIDSGEVDGTLLTVFSSGTSRVDNSPARFIFRIKGLELDFQEGCNGRDGGTILDVLILPTANITITSGLLES